MPRISKGPRLELKKYRDRAPAWVIRDGERTLGTGCHERDSQGAQRKLGEYILKKHDPAKAIDKDNPNQAKIADIMALEMKHIAKTAMPTRRKKELIDICARLGNWFGNRTVGDLNGTVQEQYAHERVFQPSAWRELKILSAAINRYLKREVGGIQMKFSPVLPDAPEARERWLTRDEAARLIMAAWRQRQTKHIARYVLVGLYTGSRHGDICGASILPSLNRGYCDLDRGTFKRKPDNKKETSKRQPTVPIPARLLAHMRRWNRLGISRHSVIEYHGQPLSRIREGWGTVLEAAGLATDNPRQKIIRHTLRHTAITWYLANGVNIETVSQYCGVSVATIRKTYRHVMPGTFDTIMDAAHKFGR